MPCGQASSEVPDLVVGIAFGVVVGELDSVIPSAARSARHRAEAEPGVVRRGDTILSMWIRVGWIEGLEFIGGALPEGGGRGAALVGVEAAKVGVA